MKWNSETKETTNFLLHCTTWVISCRPTPQSTTVTASWSWVSKPFLHWPMQTQRAKGQRANACHQLFAHDPCWKPTLCHALSCGSLTDLHKWNSLGCLPLAHYFGRHIAIYFACSSTKDGQVQPCHCCNEIKSSPDRYCKAWSQHVTIIDL